MLASVLTTAGAIGGIFGSGSKDPERLATNQQYYQRALAGDTQALAWLYAHATGTDANHDPVLGYWGSETARQDALAKYNDVIARQKVGDIAAKVAGVASTVSQAAGTVAGQAAAAAVQIDRSRNPLPSSNTLLVVAAVVVGLVLLRKRK